MRTRYVVVTGGVMSGLGKGVAASSIAKLLQIAGQKVSCVKIDPYLNYDAGTMNPVAHGEVFVTRDGGECDMDVGNYERFLDQCMTRAHNITTAQVYSRVIGRERRGEYLGACVQIIPHVTDEIKSAVRGVAAAEGLDALVVECGGTVGDIESLPFLEALRQLRVDEGAENVAYVHVTLAPSLDVVGEQKTKPTQHSVQELRRIGIQPDYLVVRCSSPLGERTKQKIAMFSNVPASCVLSSHDAPSVFAVPRMLYGQGIVDSLFKRFGKVGMMDTSSAWAEWDRIVGSLSAGGDPVRVAMVGKYVTLQDSYVSVNQALRDAGAAVGRPVAIDWLDSEEMRGPAALDGYDGVLAPGGFGARGAEGIVGAAARAMERDLPYLGICFGFQLALVAFAREACGLAGANSTEVDPGAEHPVVDMLPEQRGVGGKGGSQRLGASDVRVEPGTAARRAYGAGVISRRHRHRYEFNQEYSGRFADAGLVFSADSDGGRRKEAFELPSRRFFAGVQFHPEFDSRPGRPEETFLAFVRAAAGAG